MCQSSGDRKPVLGYKVLGDDEDLPELFKKYKFALITVGQIKSVNVRVKLFQRVLRLGFELPTIISPRAYVSKNASLGIGTIVMHDALVNIGAKIGNNCILNTKSLVEHDAIVADHCHISTSSVINGGAMIKEKTFIGSNTITKEYLTVGKNSVIGGGLRVMNEVQENTLMKNNEHIMGEKS